MNLIRRIFGAVREQGVQPALRLAARLVAIRASQWWDWGFDLINGTETAGIVETADLEISSNHKDRGIRYQPSRARPFRRLMRTLRIPPGEVFVDIGCGKGRVLVLARGFHFRKVVGVEYAPRLCEAAQRNLDAAHQSSRRAPVVVHCCDAAEYGFDEDETVIYMFNPFDSVVLQKMLERLAESLRRAPRKAWLIYLFPRWHGVIESHGLFTPDGFHVYGDCEFAVYIYDPG